MRVCERDWRLETWLLQVYHLNNQFLLCLQVNVLEPELKKPNVNFPFPWGHALLNDNHNVEWHANLAPDMEVELRLVYAVEYPRQDEVQGLPKS